MTCCGARRAGLKDTVEQLRQERDLVESITQTSPAGIMLLSPKGVITYANRRAEQVLAERLTSCWAENATRSNGVSPVRMAV